MSRPEPQHVPGPGGHAATQKRTDTPSIGQTADMDLERDPFVAASCDDLTESRTHQVTAAELLTGHGDQPQTIDLNTNEQHQVTDTFLALWKNLSATVTTRALMLSVMHGITIEPRHPAYRVSPTPIPDTYQAEVGTDATLVFHRSLDGTTTHLVWLAVIHTR